MCEKNQSNRQCVGIKSTAIVSFSRENLPVTRWKNGAGETREIAHFPSPDAPFLWRASIATLQEDSPFSRFDGVDRVIVLLEGAPFWLRGGGTEHHLQPGIPWAFAGELPLASDGITGKGMDFNIMTQRSRTRAEVSIVTTTQRPACEGVAYVLKGIWRMAGEMYTANTGIVWQGITPDELVPQSDDAALILTEIVQINNR